ncbi:hypothetical protein D3C77_775330 [compost metagenome]
MREKRFELFPMGILVLHVDVPQHRLPGPLRAHERVFAAHGVEITAPQQPVVVVLADER